MLNEISDQHLNHIKLWYLVQHSLSSFQKVIQYFTSIEKAVTRASLAQWSDVGIHPNHVERARTFYSETEQEKFQHCLNQLKSCCDFILIDSDLAYPKQLLPYADRPPILFGCGSYQNLSQPQVAIVGSRKPSAHGKQVAYDFAYYLSEKGFFITSGLAQGIDEAAHLGALKHQRTIAVVGTGLDIVYPSQNRHLQAQILAHSGTVISEFLPNTKALQHHFPRRNRIVSALSLGVLVAEAALKSGSLITAQAAANQGKITFAIPGHIYSESHQGCHQLIREGAILVDHPEQIIEDLALPTQWQYNQNNPQSKTHSPVQPENANAHFAQHDLPKNLIPTALESQSPRVEPTFNVDHLNNTQQQTSTVHNQAQTKVALYLKIQPDLPEHLFKLYQQLDWVGQSLDHLAQTIKMDTAELTGALMELELMGLSIQQSGLYLRCRPSH